MLFTFQIFYIWYAGFTKFGKGSIRVSELFYTEGRESETGVSFQINLLLFLYCFVFSIFPNPITVSTSGTILNYSLLVDYSAGLAFASTTAECDVLVRFLGQAKSVNGVFC